MKSKTSLSKLFREIQKRKIWMYAISTLLYFFGILTRVAMEIGNYYESQEDLNTVLDDIFNHCDNGLCLITLAMACVLAIANFRHVFSNKEVDFYRGAPILRKTMFSAEAISGIVAFIIPYLFFYIVSIVLYTLFRHPSFHQLGFSILWMLYYILGFLVMYFFTIVIVDITGNLITCICGVVSLSYIGSLVLSGIQYYSDTFFSSYYRNNLLGQIELFVSPVSSAIIQKEEHPISLIVFAIVFYVILFVVFAVLARYLYIKRPSEAAGRSMVFRICEKPVQIIFSIVSGMSIGLILNRWTYNHSNFWMVFGIFFGVVLTYCVINIIFHMNYRHALKGIPWMLCSVACAMLLFCVFRYDWIGYDHFVPNKNEVESVAIALNGLENYNEYYDANSMYHGRQENQLRSMAIEDIDAVFQLVNKSICNTVEDNEDSFDFVVCYRMKNGALIYRTYNVLMDDVYTELAKIYELDEFKRTLYNREVISSKEMGAVSVSILQDQNPDTGNFLVNALDLDEFEKIYFNDLDNLKFEDLKNYMRIGDIQFTATDNSYFTLPLYPVMKHTLEYMYQNGFSDGFVKNYFDVDKIQMIRLTRYQTSEEYEQAAKEGLSILSSEQYAEITNPDEIRELLNYIYPMDGAYNNYAFWSVSNDYGVEINFGTYTGYSLMLSAVLLNDQLPPNLEEYFDKEDQYIE